MNKLETRQQHMQVEVKLQQKFEDKKKILLLTAFLLQTN